MNNETRHGWAPEAERARLDKLDDAWHVAAELFSADRSDANRQAYAVAVGVYHDACEAL